jgi:hypothetical protein
MAKRRTLVLPPMSPDVAALNANLAEQAAAVPARPKLDEYKSELERRVARVWMPERFTWWRYEGVTLNLPGHRYTPDFFGVLSAGGLAVVEAKGWNANVRADRVKFNNAAATYGHVFRFCWLEWDRDLGGWLEEWR